MKTGNIQLLLKCLFNEDLVMFDKEINGFFYKTKQLKIKTPEHKLQLVWNKT